MSDIVQAGDGHQPPPALNGESLHALSNHLAIILGFVELLLADCPADSHRHADLMEIRTAAVQAAELLGHRPLAPPAGQM